MINFGMLTGKSKLSQMDVRDVRLGRFGVAGTRAMDQAIMSMTPTTESGAPINRAARTMIELAGPGASYGTNYMAALAKAYQGTPEYERRQANFYQNAEVLPEEQYQTAYGPMSPDQIAQYEYERGNTQFAGGYQPYQYLPQQPQYEPIQPMSPEPIQPKSFAQGYTPQGLGGYVAPIEPNLSIQPTGRPVYLW